VEPDEAEEMTDEEVADSVARCLTGICLFAVFAEIVEGMRRANRRWCRA